MNIRSVFTLSGSLLGGAFAFLSVAIATPRLAAQYLDGQAATSVLGQPNFTSTFAAVPPTMASLSSPGGIAVDPVTGSVFVSDTNNSRVLRYASLAAMQSGAPAVGVLGQPNFSSLTVNTTQSGMRSPNGIFVDFSGRLWVADTGNNRTLWFNNAADLVNGAPASGRLGQGSYTTMGAATSQSGQKGPRAVLVDPSGNLWIADSGNNRVLKFNGAVASGGTVNVANGAFASLVLGQLDVESGMPSVAINRLNNPSGLALDPAGSLWVADTGNNRVVSFANAASIASSFPSISVVLGQSAANVGGAGTARNRFDQPEGLFVDKRGQLYVADRVNNRVLVFRAVAAKTGFAPADAVIGATGYTDSFGGSGASKLRNPVAVAMTGDDQLLVADRLNNRVLRFAPTAFPALRSNANSVTLRPKRKRTVVFTLTNSNYPGSYRYAVPGSNRNFRVVASAAAKSATPTLAVGGSHKLAITLQGRRASKRSVPFTVSARAVSSPNRSAVKTTRVSVK